VPWLGWVIVLYSLFGNYVKFVDNATWNKLTIISSTTNSFSGFERVKKEQFRQMLDTVRTFETPESIDLQLRVAGPTVRAAAWFIDMLIRTVVYIALGMFSGYLGEMGTGLLLLSIFLLEWFYPVFFEVFKMGATPGKKRMGIRVVSDNGTPVNWNASVIRNLLRAADILPFLYGFGLITMFLNRDFKRLGDLAAGTLVIYSETKQERGAIPAAEALPPPFPLSIDEQRAILDFAERSAYLSTQRQEELANHLHEFTHELDQKAVRTLFQYANWLHGNSSSQ